jgi:hypothetical protein
MITKLEQSAIKAFILQHQDKRMTSMYVEGKILHLKSSVALLLKYFHNQHKATHPKEAKVGKGKFIHDMLKTFAFEQRALLRYRDVDATKFETSMFSALNEFKKICQDFADSNVRDQSDAIVAILLYTYIRRWEVHAGKEVDDYLDRELYDDEDEKAGYNIRPTPIAVQKRTPVVKHVHPSMDELYEEEN